MWQVLKAVTILFTIYPGLHRKTNVYSPCDFHKQTILFSKIIFFSFLLSQGEKNSIQLFSVSAIQRFSYSAFQLFSEFYFNVLLIFMKEEFF